MAHDVLQHDDGVVDDEADRDRQSHQGDVVEAIAHQIHQCAGAEQRQRNGDARDDGCPEGAQENEDHGDHQADGQQQGELNVLHGRADGLRAVAQDLHFDRRGHGGAEPRQLRLDAVDSLDDVGARLLEHDKEHAPLAGGPGGLLGILRPGDGPPDVAHAQRRAVAVGDDDVIPWLGNSQLIVGIDGVASHLTVDAALGRIDGRDRQLGTHVLERDVLGHQLGRIELDADGGLLFASDGHLANA